MVYTSDDTFGKFHELFTRAVSKGASRSSVESFGDLKSYETEEQSSGTGL